MDLVTKAADDYLLTAEASDAARLRFIQGVWEIQSRIEAVDRCYEAPDAEIAREALVKGLPLFQVSAPEVPVDEYLDAVSQMALYASEMPGLPIEQAEALRNTDFTTAVDAERLADAVRSPEKFVAQVATEMSAQTGDAPSSSAVAFVLMSALVPFLTGPSKSALEAPGEFDQRTWSGGHCPVCGGSASMGRMGESTQMKGGERTLWCGLCHAEWGYERIRCVRCGSRNPDMLRYTHVEGDPAHRVHLCDECHGYARFVFVDDLGKPVSMVVEDAVTATLDAVASSLGYTSTGDGGQSSN